MRATRIGRIAGATVLAVCAAWGLRAAHATTASGTFTAQIVIQAECKVQSTATLDFGTQGVLTANVDQQSTVQVQCTNTTPYNIGLDAGTGSGATAERVGGSLQITIFSSLIEMQVPRPATGQLYNRYSSSSRFVSQHTTQSMAKSVW